MAEPKKKVTPIKSKSLQQKLIEIQTELKAPKNQKNTFGNYNYRSCEDILEAVKPLLKEHNLLLMITDELVNIGERYYIQARVILNDTANDTQIEVMGYAREEETKKGMDGSQITGASSSYARKYALNGLFLIDDAKDSDATNKGEAKATGKASTPKPKDRPVDQVTKTERKALAESIINMIVKEGKTDEQVKAEAGDVCAHYSTFEANGKLTEGRRSPNEMSAKWCQSTRHKIEADLKKAEKQKQAVVEKAKKDLGAEEVGNDDIPIEDDTPFEN